MARARAKAWCIRLSIPVAVIAAVVVLGNGVVYVTTGASCFYLSVCSECVSYLALKDCVFHIDW